MREQSLGGQGGFREWNPLARVLAAPGQRFENPLLDFRAEASNFAKLAGLGLAFQVVSARDMQPIYQQLEPLGAKAGNISQFEESRCELLCQLAMEWQLACVD